MWIIEVPNMQLCLLLRSESGRIKLNGCSFKSDAPRQDGLHKRPLSCILPYCLLHPGILCSHRFIEPWTPEQSSSRLQGAQCVPNLIISHRTVFVMALPRADPGQKFLLAMKT